MPAPIPTVEERPPELFDFVRTQARQIEAGELHNDDALVVRMREFFTVDRMETIETVAPGWQAMAALTLPQAGFFTLDSYAAGLEPWVQCVLGAFVAAPDGKGRLPDNRALPEILHGLDCLFGVDSPASLIVQGVLLHQSLNVVPEWPNPCSLSEAEAPLCIRPTLLPLLEIMMLVDSDAWQLFDAASKAKFRASTLAVFADLRQRVAA